MCFYNDYDWYASTCDVTDGPTEPAGKCYECGCEIPAGVFRRQVFMQEHEYCQICEDEDSSDFLGTIDDDDNDVPAPEHKCNYGETFECDICQNCVNVLAAIKQAEIEAGCPDHAQQPAYGELRDALYDHEDGPKYAKRAIEMFPELASVGFVVNAAKRFGDN